MTLPRFALCPYCTHGIEPCHRGAVDGVTDYTNCGSFLYEAEEWEEDARRVHTLSHGDWTADEYEADWESYLGRA